MTTSEVGEDFIAHYGVKGMKWGVRKHREITATTHVDVGVVKRQTKVRTTGGESHPAHEDAVKAAISKAKLKKSGTAALSNKELRDLRERIQLEDHVNMLTKRKGKKFLAKELETAGRAHVQRGLVTGTGAAVKKGAKVGGAAAVLLA
jgi:hypothetical protein